MNVADVAIVYLDEHTFALKQMNMLQDDAVKSAFGNQSLQIIRKPTELKERLLSEDWQHSCVLLMSSGNFGGMNLDELITTKMT